MSNPAVITLLNIPTKSGGLLKIEDNIGESIHLHYDNFRLDFTIKEFLDFAMIIEDSINDLVNVDGFKVENYDPLFLHAISKMLIHLVRVEQHEESLSDLIIAHKGFLGLSTWGSLTKSRVFKALNGDIEENDIYSQENFYGIDNNTRVESIKTTIETKGYPYNNEYIVLFNNQNVIRDGQHRAASLLFSGKVASIPIKRFYFKNNRFNSVKYRWLNSIIPVLKSKAKCFTKRVLLKLRILKYLR